MALSISIFPSASQVRYYEYRYWEDVDLWIYMELPYPRFLGIRNLYGFKNMYRAFIHLHSAGKLTRCQYRFVNLYRFLDLYEFLDIYEAVPPNHFFETEYLYVFVCISILNRELYIDSLFYMKIL